VLAPFPSSLTWTVRASGVVQVNGGTGLAGVTVDVSERLLHDPVCHLVDVGRKRPLSAANGDGYGQSGGARACHQEAKWGRMVAAWPP
jgi:hypothetical protein